MAIENSLTVSNLRIIPRKTDFLDRKVGSRGEVYFDQDTNTIRLFDGTVSGGIALLRADLENIEGQISSVIPSPTPPIDADPGTIWFDTTTGKSYVLYDDGNSSQWVQPATPSIGGGTTPGGGGASNISELNDVSLSSLTAGQVLKWDGAAWTNSTDLVGTGGGGIVNIDELGDVTITTPAAGEFLRYNGAEWTNGTINTFTKIAVSGQEDIDADTGLDTLTITAGSGIQITTDAGTDSITITNTIANAAEAFTELSDVVNSGLTVDKIYLPAITRLRVSNSGAIAYLFDQYTGNNPQVYAISGTTIAFELTASGHPFLIQDGTGTNYDTGLVHVSISGVVSTGSAAQGKDSGTLYWKIPVGVSGGYRYQCQLHGSMVGNISVKNIAII